MKLIKPSFLIKEQEPGLLGIYRQIEYAGRICYKSSDKITEDSAKSFVDRMIISGHGAMLEHGTVYLDFTDDITEARKRYIKNPYSKVYKNTLEEDWDYPHLYVVTNFRIIVENNWLGDLKYMCEPTEFHEKRLSFKITTDKSISHELVRHRKFSFAQESTRYCNYTKDKFNHELTFILPELWTKDFFSLNISLIDSNVFDNERYNETGNEVDVYNYDNELLRFFLYSCIEVENLYNKYIDNNIKPEEARCILPICLKTEIVMTGFESDWKYFLKLRTAKSAHPYMRHLAFIIKSLINKNNQK